MEKREHSLKLTDKDLKGRNQVWIETEDIKIHICFHMLNNTVTYWMKGYVEEPSIEVLRY